MKLIGPLLLTTLFVCGCSKNYPITEISLERKGCFGPCRVYKVTLRGDGSATYICKENVERIGTFTNHQFWPVTYQFKRLADAIAGQGSTGSLDNTEA